MPHRSYASTANYRFGFNGKENDNEPKGLDNQQDYGMRIYDPRLGKFLSVDPITNQYPELTPFQYASNNPTSLIDVDGMEGGWELSTPASNIRSNFELKSKYPPRKNVTPATSTPSPSIKQVHSEDAPVEIKNIQSKIHQVNQVLESRKAYQSYIQQNGYFSSVPMSASVKAGSPFGAHQPNIATIGATPPPRPSNEFEAGAVAGVQMASTFLAAQACPNCFLALGGTEMAMGVQNSNSSQVFSGALTMSAGLLSGYGKVATTSEVVAYRAINSEYASSTSSSGEFFRSGAAGRLGNDGIYANTSIEGAIREFEFHNPNTKAAVFEVRFTYSKPLNVSPPSLYYSSPLPFTQGVNILASPSLRAPGTTNLLIREGAKVGKRIL